MAHQLVGAIGEEANNRVGEEEQYETNNGKWNRRCHCVLLSQWYVLRSKN